MKKNIFRIFGFLLTLTIILSLWDRVFRFKHPDGILDLTNFYELEDNCVDVLLLGSSHAFCDFNTGTLWDEYGMSSFMLGGPMQPMWNTYYYLKEALKTQAPKVIVLEGYSTTFTEEYLEDSYTIKNTFGLSLSKEKLEALTISSPYYRWDEFFLEYTQYHGRYTEINKSDFQNNLGDPYYKDWKGSIFLMQTVPMEANNISYVTESKELATKTEKYYRKVLELAQEKNIPIVVVISPYASISEDEQKSYNKASIIAKEYNIPFINCNTMNDIIGIDYSSDVADSKHLNYQGSIILSRYLGNYLTENYAIPNHKGDPQYNTWELNSSMIKQSRINYEVLQSTDFDILISKVKSQNYWLSISLIGDIETNNPTVSSYLNQMGITPSGDERTWIVKKNVLDNKAEDAFKSTIHLAEPDKISSGIAVTVFDPYTQSVVISFGLDANSNYALVK